MYADQVAAGRKRSVHERLDGGYAGDAGGLNSGAASKRQRQSDGKWKHDLYREDDEPRISKTVGSRDLRLKLQKKASHQLKSGAKRTGMQDLREKLSGIVKTQPQEAQRPRTKPASEVVKPSSSEPRKEVSSVQTTKRAAKPTLPNTSQQKPEAQLDGFLRPLGLEKYSITFQAEEVDMAALKHMTDSDLKALGIPMGPRKKILLALGSRG